MISCLIVNYNCLKYTKALIDDLLKQSYTDYDVLLIDQNSVEDGTDQFLNSYINHDNFTVIKNNFNRPLNHIWNDFVRDAKGEYCAFLNNDITIPPNFLSDNFEIFSKESDVSCVIHPTNHPQWNIYTPNKLSYKVLDKRTRQGWDFTFRKSDWITIPEVLDFYCGDDFIFENVYLRNKRVAVALSSPIIHWLSQTRKSPLNKVIPNRNPIKDVENYKKLGFKHYLDLLPEYSKIDPTITSIDPSI
jgi:glycosyltransferase involved in cell wall biosynthesis